MAEAGKELDCVLGPRALGLGDDLGEVSGVVKKKREKISVTDSSQPGPGPASQPV